MEFTAEHIEKAVSHFYQDLTTQSQLNMWLTSAQVSSQAWVFSWQLLDRTKSIEVQFFGASSLQTKISKCWHELSPEQYIILREKLTSILITYCGGPKIVLTRLCLALSSFILHSIPEIWTNPLSDILSMLQQLSGSARLQPQFVTLLLEILTVLPEEFQTMRLSHERRIAVRAELLSAAKDVLPILREAICQGISQNKIVSADDEASADLGIRCLSSWIQHGVGIGLEESVHLIEPLLAVTQNETLSEGALDALTNLVNHPEAQRFPSVLMGMLSHLLTLQDLLQSLRREGDFARAAQVYAVFAAFGESHSRLLLDSVLEGGIKKDHVLQLVQILLESTGTPGRYNIDENCSHLAFSFWYILQDDICASAPEKHKVYYELFSPAYLALVDILMTKSIVGDDSEWTAEDKETFRCYRQDIADTLAYCYKFLRNTMMERLVTHFTTAVAQYNRNQDAWPQLEACLHALKAVAENVEAEEEHLVPQILSLFGNIHFTGNRQVVNMALETLGSYAEWLSAHPAYLGHVLPILLFGLSSPEAAPAATMALKDITRDCQMGIRPYAESLLHACEQALILDDLKAGEKVRLMYILGKVLSILPLEAIVICLNRAVGPCVEDIRSLCGKMECDAATKCQLITRLKMIATLCTTLDVRAASEESEDDTIPAVRHQNASTSQQPVLLIAQQLLPFLKVVVDKWGADEQVTESICLVVKHVTSTLMDETLPFLPDMASVIVQCHRRSPQSATLDVAKMILLMFGQTPGEAQTLIRAFLSEIINTTLQFCGVSATVSTDGVPTVDMVQLANSTEVLASFLVLLAQLLRKTPRFLSGSTYPIPSLFYCGIVGLSRPESPTLKSATQYLVHFISQSRDMPELVNVVQSQGQLLVDQLLRCIGGESPRTLVEHLADVLLALNKKYFDNLCRWLNLALGRENFPSVLVSPQQKENFCKMILKERSNKRRLQDIVRDFCLHCRGLIGTEYSEQMINMLHECK